MAVSTKRRHKAWVSGASRGIGRAVSERLLSEGFEVWGTSRSLPQQLSQADGYHAVTFDLAESGASFLRHEEESGGFDLVVNNAGYGLFGAFETLPALEWERQLGEMIQGNLRVVHAAMTTFRRKGGGTLVNISSLAAEFPLPFMSGYNVAKAALSALSESLMQETRGTSIVVIDFRPGDYRTEFNEAVQAKGRALARSEAQDAAWQALERNLQAAPLPEKAARDLVAAVKAGRSGTVRSGDFFQATAAPFLARLAPATWRRALTARYFGIP